MDSVIVQVEVIHITKEEDMIVTLQFRVCSEANDEWPLHRLPALLTLLNQKHLNSYTLQLFPNEHHHFNFELYCNYPRVEDNLVCMDLREKIRRLHQLYYGPREEPIETLPLDKFIKRLAAYTPTYPYISDKQLFNMPYQMCNLLEAYQFTVGKNTPANDPYFDMILESQKKLIFTPTLASACPFDKPAFLKTQVIKTFQHFMVTTNHSRRGESDIQLMVIPKNHQVDLKDLTPKNINELEAIFRTINHLPEQDIFTLRFYLQKHASSGMTVPHIHFHIILPPTEKDFKRHALHELRYFITGLEGTLDEAHYYPPDVRPLKELKLVRNRVRKEIDQVLLKLG